ncbi:LuxR C-terminal-related transcriptional regulator [Verminephrobacter aporrectodeae]|uniref:LuxR C-terminal-related transcriptional regulator n=1 Tax=Verminephrobacter aporrectodeae TaxID=1110389 RepID=UPI0038B34FF4
MELAEREIEVLRWTADGKASADTAKILRISDAYGELPPQQRVGQTRHLQQDRRHGQGVAAGPHLVARGAWNTGASRRSSMP